MYEFGELAGRKQKKTDQSLITTILWTGGALHIGVKTQGPESLELTSRAVLRTKGYERLE